VATQTGQAQAARAALDERRWQVLRSDPAQEDAAARYDGLTPLETILTPDQLETLDRAIKPGLVT
jgi:manganese/zinc/iron transport system permease protein